MKWFVYDQNNSGGSFDYIPAEGISCYVLVEAIDAEHADDKARRFGIYFDGVDNGTDCDCCGDRWYRADDGLHIETGYDTPTLYGKEIRPNMPWDEYAFEHSIRWIKDGPMGYIHYANGLIEPTLV